MSYCYNKRRLKGDRHRNSGRPGHHHLFSRLSRRFGIDLILTTCLRTVPPTSSIQCSHLQAMISRLHTIMLLLPRPCLRTIPLIAGKLLKILLLVLVLLDSKRLPVDKQDEDTIRYQMNILSSNLIALGCEPSITTLALLRSLGSLKSQLHSSSQ
jgi:hypothetical protein